MHLCVFQNSLICRTSLKIAKATQRNPVSKTERKKGKRERKEKEVGKKNQSVSVTRVLQGSHPAGTPVSWESQEKTMSASRRTSLLTFLNVWKTLGSSLLRSKENRRSLMERVVHLTETLGSGSVVSRTGWHVFL